MEAEITKPIYRIGESVVVALPLPDAVSPAYRISEIRAGYWTGTRWEYEMYSVKGMVAEEKIINNFTK